jgi:hypothetical protein
VTFFFEPLGHTVVGVTQDPLRQVPGVEPIVQIVLSGTGVYTQTPLAELQVSVVQVLLSLQTLGV